ncbi:hypothetical protein HDU91_003358 [Kappamyces sp. JEL0680]|nr:hypothetical protein HDU91_003358 [Kappamyces sp. JEL0680]
MKYTTVSALALTVLAAPRQESHPAPLAILPLSKKPSHLSPVQRAARGFKHSVRKYRKPHAIAKNLHVFASCHSQCSTGSALSSSCGSCVSEIIAQDSYCGNTEWDSVCVGEVASICGLSCSSTTTVKVTTTTTATTGTTSSTGAPMTNEQDELYIVPVTLGNGQKFTLDLDTGSSDTVRDGSDL